MEFPDETRVPNSNSSGLSDNLLKTIKYYKVNKQGYYARRIPFTNSQDKAEEEVIAAVKFNRRYHKSV